MEFIGEVCPWNKGVRFPSTQKRIRSPENGGEYRYIKMLAQSTHVKKTKGAEDMFEELGDVDADAYSNALDDLAEIGLLVKLVDTEDKVSYIAGDGLSWSNVATYSCPIKKRILLCLIDNPRTFFVLYNTQKGKSRIVTMEIKSWAKSTTRVVAFLMVDNDKSLADQTTQGLLEDIRDVGEIFLLSSSAKAVPVAQIQTYIDAYAADSFGEYKMPVIVALNNKDQVKKVLKLMDNIKARVENRASPLRYGIVFDEADKVYPPRREEFKPHLVDSDIAVHRIGFATATDGKLLDNEDYEECANAYNYPISLEDDDYRAFHHSEAIIKLTPHRRQDNNDAYAEQIIAANSAYFREKVQLKNGTMGYRKIIVNGGAKTESMSEFAKRRTADGGYAMTINMLGVTVYRPGQEYVRRSAKGCRLGTLLFTLYNELGLHDKPLFIIGRRKVDRGLGFHHAPRDGSDGLIWTDMILGRIEDKDTAVQKAGRLAGIVTQCPQCPTALTWWTDTQTKALILYHNTTVDHANTHRGDTILQAMTRAKASAEQLKPTAPEKPKPEPIHHLLCREEDAHAVIKVLYGNSVEIHDFGKDASTGLFKAAVGGKADVQVYADITTKLRNLTGGKGENETHTRCVPCYIDKADATTLRYVFPLFNPTEDGAKFVAQFPQVIYVPVPGA
jgi:hypothetical protein